MSVLGWLITAVLLYTALWKMLFVVADGVVRKDWGQLAMAAVLIIAAGILAPVFPEAATPHGIPEGTTRFLVYELFAFAGMVAAGAWVIASIDPPLNSPADGLAHHERDRRALLSHKISRFLGVVAALVAFYAVFCRLATSR